MTRHIELSKCVCLVYVYQHQHQQIIHCQNADWLLSRHLCNQFWTVKTVWCGGLSNTRTLRLRHRTQLAVSYLSISTYGALSSCHNIKCLVENSLEQPFFQLSSQILIHSFMCAESHQRVNFFFYSILVLLLPLLKQTTAEMLVFILNVTTFQTERNGLKQTVRHHTPWLCLAMYVTFKTIWSIWFGYCNLCI